MLDWKAPPIPLTRIVHTTQTPSSNFTLLLADMGLSQRKVCREESQVSIPPIAGCVASPDHESEIKTVYTVMH